MRACWPAILLSFCCAAAHCQQQPAGASPRPAVGIWTCEKESGKARDRFLPGETVVFHVRVSTGGLSAQEAVRVSLRLEDRDNRPSALGSEVRATGASAETLFERSYEIPEDLPQWKCGTYHVVAELSGAGAPVVARAPFSIEQPVVIERFWVDRLATAQPRVDSNRLVVGHDFYYHARHSISDLVDLKNAELTIEWRVLPAGDKDPPTASVTRRLDGDPQERVLSRVPAGEPPGRGMAGPHTLSCIARLGAYRSASGITSFIVLSQTAEAAAAPLVSVSARPTFARPGSKIALTAKYRVTGVAPGERAALVERLAVSGGGRQWYLPLRSVERANGFFVVTDSLSLPTDALPGDYRFEFNVIAPQRALCNGAAAFTVQALGFAASELSLWPKKVKPGGQLTVAFRFAAAGLAGDEPVPVERVITIKGPRSMTLRRKGWLRRIPTAVYRTREMITIPQGWPAGEYQVSAGVTAAEARTKDALSSFEVVSNP